jgi:dihydroorotate dehydrogenase
MVYFCLINKLDPKLAKNDIIKINTKSKEIDQNVVISINTCRVAEIKSNTQNEQTTFISNKFF